MKKFLTGLLVLLCMAALTGCGKNDISLTNEENDLVAEYIAGTLLKYSCDNEWKYQKLNTAQKTGVTTTAGTNSSTQTPTQSQAGNSQKPTASSSSAASTATVSASGTAGTTSTDLMGSLPSALGLSGVTVKYKDYVTGSSYPSDAYVSVPAQSGCEVVAVELTLTNTSGQAVTLNSSGNVTFKLEVGGTGVVNYASILKNDITALKNVSLAAGASKDVVVLFQVKESDASSVAGASMTATSSGTSLGSLTIN
ncbi:MAG: hypothetical protein UE790_05305 [Lachnospira sp.]|nr:hypothetical protein [Lachnospira sp.]